jgi:Phage tail protein.
MAFNAVSFTYDGIPGDIYGLMLYEIGSSSGTQSSNTYDAEIQSALSASSRQYVHYKTVVDKPLEITFTIGSLTPIDALMRGKITAWLMGRQEYKNLRILQGDYAGMYFKCIFTKQSTIFVNGLAYAFSITAVCDSPFVYSAPLVQTFDIGASETIINVLNKSDILDEYIYPKLEFTATSSLSSLSIKNLNDNNREFAFSNLVTGETIFADNENKIITSSSGISRLQSFNKFWFRLVGGLNKVVVAGKGILTLTVPVLRKAGF